MRVYIVEAFTAESYEDYSWVDSVWASKEEAEKYVENNPGLLYEDPEEREYGYFLRKTVEGFDVR